MSDSINETIANVKSSKDAAGVKLNRVLSQVKAWAASTGTDPAERSPASRELYVEVFQKDDELTSKIVGKYQKSLRSMIAAVRVSMQGLGEAVMAEQRAWNAHSSGSGRWQGRANGLHNPSGS